MSGNPLAFLARQFGPLTGAERAEGFDALYFVHLHSEEGGLLRRCAVRPDPEGHVVTMNSPRGSTFRLAPGEPFGEEALRSRFATEDRIVSVRRSGPHDAEYARLLPEELALGWTSLWLARVRVQDQEVLLRVRSRASRDGTGRAVGEWREAEGDVPRTSVHPSGEWAAVLNELLTLGEEAADLALLARVDGGYVPPTEPQ